MLHCLPLYIHVALSETLNAPYGVVDQVIDQIFIQNLLFIDSQRSQPHYDLRVVNEASLHNFR